MSQWFVVKRTVVIMDMLTGEEIRHVSYHAVSSVDGDEIVLGPLSKSAARSEAQRLEAAAEVLDS